MPRRKRIGPCGVCGIEGALTKEDVFPTWLRSEMRGRHLLDGELPPRIILHVCARCNGGMSAAFEHDAARLLKPMIWGQRAIGLSAHESKTLARWMVKTDALFALHRGENPREGYDLSERDARQLRALVRAMIEDRSLLPSHVVARVGLVDPNAREAPGVMVPKAARDAVGDGWLTSFHPVGLLVLQTVLFANHGGDEERYLRAVRRDPRMVVVSDRDAEWPPQELLSLSDPERMRAELGHHPRNIVGGGWMLGIERNRPLPSTT